MNVKMREPELALSARGNDCHVSRSAAIECGALTMCRVIKATTHN